MAPSPTTFVKTADPVDLFGKCANVMDENIYASLVFNNDTLIGIRDQVESWKDGQILLTRFCSFLNLVHEQTGVGICFISEANASSVISNYMGNLFDLKQDHGLTEAAQFCTIGAAYRDRAYDRRIPIGISFYSCPMDLTEDYGLTMVQNPVIVLPSDPRFGAFLDLNTFDPSRPGAPQRHNVGQPLESSDIQVGGAYRLIAGRKAYLNDAYQFGMRIEDCPGCTKSEGVLQSWPLVPLARITITKLTGIFEGDITISVKPTIGPRQEGQIPLQLFMGLFAKDPAASLSIALPDSPPQPV